MIDRGQRALVDGLGDILQCAGRLQVAIDWGWFGGELRIDGGEVLTSMMAIRNNQVLQKENGLVLEWSRRGRRNEGQFYERERT